ncbi:hypothetical protein HK103_001264 [Boothiomyces macroporosus]|uniref:Alpha-amylase n=1 Tax=Boothiomyces macroporosus TaxID=261099 RepID=A0AAD5UNI7_9FUNG|nr:hypothetical protein HK103_001264 [Boothiomyces macroporosus]
MISVLLLSLVDAHYVLNDKFVGVQLFQYPFDDIKDECANFLGPNGYGWVQTSPVAAHASSSFDGQTYPWYLAYQPVSYQIGNRLGTLDQFANMTKVCKEHGVDVVVDVVLNHFSYAGHSGSTIGIVQNWSSAVNQENFPSSSFTASDFHDGVCNGPVNYNSPTVPSKSMTWNQWNCRPGGDDPSVQLIDVATDNSNVQNAIASYLNLLLSYGVVGFRTDLATFIDPSDWAAIQAKLNLNYKGNVPYFVQEAYSMPDTQDLTTNTNKDYRSLGRVYNVEGYTQNVGKAFRNYQGMSADLAYSAIASAGAFADSSHSGTFIENHDQERNKDGQAFLPLSRLPGSNYNQAIAFNILYPFGLTTVHSGYKFTWNGGDDFHRETPVSAPTFDNGILKPVGISNGVCPDAWLCQHRWTSVYPLVKVRNFIGTAPATPIKDNGFGSNQIYWTNPGKAFVAINNSPSNSMTNTVFTGLASGVYCNIAKGSSVNGQCVSYNGGQSESYTVDSNGNVQLNASPSSAVVLYGGSDGLVSALGATPASPAPATQATVNFRVVHQTAFGDAVYVVGTFNNWNTCKAISCSWSTGNVWNCGSITVPLNSLHQWKPIVFGTGSSTSCSNPIWSTQPNRKFLAADQLTATSLAF